jgi:hypothetical protein
MDLNNLVSIPRASKTTDRAEHWIRRRLINGQIRGEKIGRDWYLYSEEVQRLEQEFPVTP